MITEFRKKFPSIIIWMVAAWLAMYFVWNFLRCMETISFALGTGQVTMRNNLYDIVGFFMESSIVYLVYALLLWAAGLILWRSGNETSHLYDDDFEDEDESEDEDEGENESKGDLVERSDDENGTEAESESESEAEA